MAKAGAKKNAGAGFVGAGANATTPARMSRMSSPETKASAKVSPIKSLFERAAAANRTSATSAPARSDPAAATVATRDDDA